MIEFVKDYIKPYWKHIAIILIFTLLQVYFQIGIMKMTKVILDNGVHKNDLNFIYNTGIYMLLLTALYGLTMLVTSYLSSSVSAGVACDINEGMYEKILSLSPYDFNKFGGSSLMTRATADSTTVQSFMINILRIGIQVPLVIVGVIIATMQVNPLLSIILITSFAIAMIYMGLKSRKSLPLFTEVQEKLDNLNLQFKEKIEGVRSIRAFGKQEYEIEKFNKLNEDFNYHSKNAELQLYYLTPLALIIINLSVLVIYYIGSVQLQLKIISISDLILFFQYVTYFTACFGIVNFIVNTSPKTIVAAKRLEEVLYFENTIVNDANEEEYIQENAPLVEYKNVIFGYTGAKNVIADISFKAEKGTTTAFIGPTGSGKSTIMYLLNRLFDSTFGEILYNGQNIKQMDIKELRENISYASQKTMVFNDTVYANIAMNNANLSREKAEEVCELTRFSEVFKFLPDGLDSMMAKGGMNVSGGQKQRLSLARTLAKDAEVYVFDDCFSALDAKTEYAVRENVKNYLKGKTVFMIAQKISTIIDADNIIVVDKGHIVSQGTHEELLATCELYQEIYATQSYVKEGE